MYGDKTVFMKALTILSLNILYHIYSSKLPYVDELGINMGSLFVNVLSSFIFIVTVSLISKSIVIGLFDYIVLSFSASKDIINQIIRLEYSIPTILLAIIFYRKIIAVDRFLSLDINAIRYGRDPWEAIHRITLLFSALSISLFVYALMLKTDIINFLPRQDNLLLIITNTVISILVAISNTSISSIIFSAIITPLGIYSLASILTLFSTPYQYLKAGLSNILEKYGGGIYLGDLKAVLTYGYPIRGEVYGEEPRGSGRRWYWAKTYKPIHISLSRLPNNHVVIVGASGTGKSTIAKHLVQEAYMKEGFNFIIFDQHGEYTDLLEYTEYLNIVDASKISINPLELNGRTPHDRAHEVSYMIQSIYRLGPLQRQIIEELIIETYKYKGIFPDDPRSWVNKPPSFKDLVEYAEMKSIEDEYVRRIIPYLKMLSSDIFSYTSISFQETIKKPTIILLNTIPSEQVRSLYIIVFLYKLINHMYNMVKYKGNSKVLVVIDEAHIVLKYRAGRTILSKLLMESRKYGLGVVTITQYPLHIPESMYQNVVLRMSFNISEPRSNNYISKLLAGTGDPRRLRVVQRILSSIDKYHYVLSIMGNRSLLLIDSSNISSVNTENKVKSYR